MTRATKRKPRRAPRPEPDGTAKIAISIRVAPATLEAFRATGSGWQGRMCDALDGAAGRLPGAHDGNNSDQLDRLRRTWAAVTGGKS